MKMQCEFLEVDNDAEEGKDLKGRMAAEKGSVPKDQEVRSLLPTDEIGLAARDCIVDSADDERCRRVITEHGGDLLQL